MFIIKFTNYYLLVPHFHHRDKTIAETLILAPVTLLLSGAVKNMNIPPDQNIATIKKTENAAIIDDMNS